MQDNGAPVVPVQGHRTVDGRIVAGKVVEVDVVVVGSGAGALTAAVRAHDHGLKVLVIEKTELYGGTSAVSGGGIWIPNNDHIERDGGSDSEAEAMDYLRAATRGEVAEERLAAYVHQAPRMLRWVEKHTPVRYRAVPFYADYYQTLPGAKTGYRTLDPEPFDARCLGDELLYMRETSPTMLIFGRMGMTTFEAVTLLARLPGWKKLALRIFGRYWGDALWRLRSRRDRRLTMGSALVGALRRATLDRGIPLWIKTSMQSLVVESDRVTGVKVMRDGRPMTVMAQHGVVLAAGGFESNQRMREQYLPQPTNVKWTAAPPCNTGDAIRAGQGIGAALDAMQHAWWTPTVHVPGEEKQRGLFSERALPGCVVVNRKGERFANEAMDYLDFVAAMYEDHEKTGANLPAFMVFDANFRHKYNAGPLVSGSVIPDRRLPADWLGKAYFRADTLGELARQIGVDAQALQRTVARMNEYAASGVDEQFGKGGNSYDRIYGDPSVQPNPCLGPIVKGPFYALKLDAGEIGTKGGLLTDAHARVLGLDGRPIRGLYACGNTSASITGPSYPGAGATLGPAMTFGFIAANDIAAQVQAVTEDARRSAHA
jgi:3-oxosteroid 1-dehydrogenase